MTQHEDAHDPSFTCWWRAAQRGDVHAMAILAGEYGTAFDEDASIPHLRGPRWDEILAGAQPPGVDPPLSPDEADVAERCALALFWARRAALADDAFAARELASWIWRLGPPRRRALPWYERAANGGDGEAAHMLGELLLRGAEDVPAAPREASRWLRRARDLHLRALEREEGSTGYRRVRLGELYLYGAGVRRDIPRALACWEQAAESGYTWAMLRLAGFHADGVHAAHDFERARHWWQRAADLGDAEAARQLANLAQRRHDAARDAAARLPLAQLKRWAERGDVALFRPGSTEPRLAAVLAIAGGSPFNLLSHVITRLEQARQRRAAWCLLEAEARQSPLAAMNLARRHELGWAGAKQDLGAALRWLRHAAQAGEPLAMAGLAQRLQHADYGTPDAEQAAAWLRLAQQPRFVSRQRGVDAAQLAAQLGPPLAELEATFDAHARARVEALVAACDGDDARWPGASA